MLAPPSDGLAAIPGVGDVIAGRYQVEAYLGKGGMGYVVAARHLLLGQRVAIKFPLPTAADPATERFLREARAAVAIQNEHIARVLDVGTLSSGTPFIVMEYLAGVDLHRWIRQRGPLPVAEAVDAILQVGEVLAEAHSLGIIHRDLKPSNLFATARADGSLLIKVLDFGLSKVTAPEGQGARDTSLTTTETVLGSPPYMSPEQLRSLKGVDARTDIWSLGVIFYLLLTARRPFKGDTLTDVCASIAFDEPPPLSAHRPDIPAEIELAIRQCLVKDPASRLQTVAQLARSIAPFGSTEAQRSMDRILRATRDEAPVSGAAPIPAGPPRSTSRPLWSPDAVTMSAGSWSKPHPPSRPAWRARLAAAAAVTLAIGAIAWLSLQKRAAPLTLSSRPDVLPTAAPAGASAAAVLGASIDPATPAPLAAPLESAPVVTPADSALPAAASAPLPSAEPPKPPARLRLPGRTRRRDPLDRWN